MKKIQIISDKNSKSSKIKSSIIKILKKNKINKSNLIIVVGGDGFMLQTLKKYYKYKKPFYGINSGNYGFLMNRFSKKNPIKNLLNAKSLQTIEMLQLISHVSVFHVQNEISLIPVHTNEF